MSKLHVKAKDQVVVISGNDKGKQGKVMTAYPATGRVVVEGVAIATMHKKPRRQGQPGGIIHKEAAIDASNVMLVCGKCGRPTRVGHRIADNGAKIRVCKKCGQPID